MKRIRKPRVRPPALPLPRARRRLFTIVVAVIPWLLLAGLELFLRRIDYGGNLDLVVRTRIAKEEMFRINRDVGRRYFAGSGTSIPEPADDAFRVRKPKNTIRIFCLGESTMAGFPYEFHATAPGFLRDRLRALLPGYEVEMVNAGLSAAGSFIVGDFLEELGNYQPDLYIVYVGHNEFYGAYGVGSRVGIPGGGLAARLALSLLRFRTFLLARDAYLELRDRLAPPPDPRRGSLMAQVVREQTIPYGSDLYRRAREIYTENLGMIIREARSQGVPLILCSLVSNTRTQAPFSAVHGPGLPDETRRRWDSLMARGTYLEMRTDAEAALACYRQAAALDTLHAGAFFAAGSVLFGKGDYREAEAMFARARDLDALRFRASAEFMDDLGRICRATGTPLAPVDSAFRRRSPGGIPGSELLLEHLHPNVDGYFLMAKVLARTIRGNRLLVPADAWADSAEKGDDALMESSTVSDFDRTVGRIRVELLMRRWPFASGPPDVRFIPAGFLDSLAFEYIRGRLAWSDARYLLADRYAARGMYGPARRECLAVAKVIPFSYQPLLRVADYYRDEGLNTEAKRAYRECFRVEENPYARMKLAIILVDEGNGPEAEREILRALEVERTGPRKFGAGAHSSAWYLLALSRLRQGRQAEARRDLEESLTLDPANELARGLLGRLPPP
ncbi:MAG: tetratricopeptide repeat protein [Bacteroidota bacterium]